MLSLDLVCLDSGRSRISAVFYTENAKQEIELEGIGVSRRLGEALATVQHSVLQFPAR